MTNCIAVLTRGYNNILHYNTLIKRNKHIVSNLKDKSIDVLIFHEGNITEEHQLFIKNETPEIKIQFVNISDVAFQSYKKNVVVEEVPFVGINYRHMCSFWFVNFFDAVKNYDKLLRIDEDCFIDSSIDEIFVQLDTHLFVTGREFHDYEFVTKGLNDFSLDFLNKYKDVYTFKKEDPKKPDGPYTNVIGLSLDKILNNEMFLSYRNEIDKSDMIYKRRWGDLPLWGEVIYYIFGKDTLKNDTNIKYFHGSHKIQVN
jgi:hypothetical protein